MSDTRVPYKFYFNVILKVNTKIGGTNFVLKENPFLVEKTTIIFGADVSHPGPGSPPDVPSIAAVVASVDEYAVQYGPSIRFQKGRVEIIQDLSDMVIERLEDFYKKNKKKPERILFCRDGVSEGQFKQVVDKELEAIKEACRSFYRKNESMPKITFLVAQKRHHTRFYPLDSKNADSSGNVPPGFVCETAITHPFEYDFYLQSHAGLQGTSRPCHYYILSDENNLPPDKIQKF